LKDRPDGGGRSFNQVIPILFIDHQGNVLGVNDANALYLISIPIFLKQQQACILNRF
jgi:hypothetical protein